MAVLGFVAPGKLAALVRDTGIENVSRCSTRYSPGYYAAFFDDPINGIHWELAWLPKVPTPRQVWLFYRAIREQAGSRPDLAKTVPGLTWQAQRTLPSGKSQ